VAPPPGAGSGSGGSPTGTDQGVEGWVIAFIAIVGGLAAVMVIVLARQSRRTAAGQDRPDRLW
jgi:hypothetical protein